MDSQHQQQRKVRRSSSRSPSLTRRPSLKEKSGSSGTGISKLKKKGSGSKKERWLLTRKTWRYMSDAVGSLLPEHKEKTRSSSPTGQSTSTSRRPSSSLSSPVTPTTPAPVVPAGHTYSIGIVPAGHSYVHCYPQPWPLYSPVTCGETQGKRASVTRSSVCSGSGYVPLETDIPALEEHFDSICRKEKKFLLWNRTRAKGLSGPALRELKLKDQSRTRTPSNSSLGGRPGTPETPRATENEQKESLLEYYSPEEEDLLDDYDEYEPDEEQMTIREFPHHRKSSSGASSIVSLVSGGLSFFRPSQVPSSHVQLLSLSSPPPGGSGDSFYVVTLAHGIQKYYRNTGIQTEPFPEEILIRLRLQSVREEQLQREEQERSQLTKEDVEQSQETDVKEVEREACLSPESPSPEIQDCKTAPSESFAVSTEGDKKSEESGYSSSISDTVMRYLRMVRKNSKSDTKETIDKFKTVNYDRSLRYIKSKNVTVEEALEHEKNKALQAQQKDQPPQLSSEGSTTKQQENVSSTEESSIPTSKGQTTGSQSKTSKKVQGSKKGKHLPKECQTPKDQSKNKTSVPIPLEFPSSPETTHTSTPTNSPPPEPSPTPPVEPTLLPSIGVQAGESLIRFLKNLNPIRKFSDISSSYCSSESPGEITSPRYSIATGSDASEIYLHQHPSSDGQRHYYSGGSLGQEYGEMSSYHPLPKQQRDSAPATFTAAGSPYPPLSSLKKSSSALQMRTTGLLTLGSSTFLYSPDHSQDYSALVGKSSSSSPSTPTISPSILSRAFSGSSPEPLKSSSRHIPSTTRSSYTHSSSYTSTAAHFLSSLRSRGSSNRGQSQYSASTPTPSGGGGGFAESISSFISKHSVISSGNRSKGHDSGVSFKGSLVRGGSGKSSGGRAAHSTSDTSPSSHSSSLVMQKSKSSSSVFHPHGSSGEKRGSTSSTGGVISIGGTTSTGTGSRLMSKTRIFKSRSKSTGRTPPACNWTPLGKCIWTSATGRQVKLEGTNIFSLSEKEVETLQQVALAKLQALNLGVEIKIPREKVVQNLKPKRRPYLLKKKALSTGFFDTGTKEGQESSGGSGLVFGIPLSQCIQNDKQRQDPLIITSGSSRAVLGDLDVRTSTSQHKRSQNGSRNSVSSVYEAKEKMGSNESLFWGKRGSCGGLVDPLSGSTGDILAENIPSLSMTSSAVVPSVVKGCIHFLETHALHTTGIFRVSTSLKRIRQLREDIDSGKEIVFGEEHSPHDVAALLKEFLRDLPEPLLCRDLYNAFLKTQKIRNRRLQLEAVQHLIQLLPLPNRDTLAAILKFFAKVVENALDTKTKTGETLNGNKMESYSLATLIAPNILPFIPVGMVTPSGDASGIQTRERRESIDVVNYMITNYQELFEISPELLDEVYVHLMDTDPEVVESILKQKALPTSDDPTFDELETTSSVFEGSEPGETWDADEASGGARKFQKREDILHKDAGTGGQPNLKAEKSRSRRDGSKDRVGVLDGDKQQSGGESDSSSTKSTTRWFRRGRADPKIRTSSDSGSEKVKGKRRDSSLGETKRASSLDSVSLKESIPSKVVAVTEHVDRQRSSSDQNLKVPEAISRRQSSPVLEGSGVITASLKIPVPLSIDDSDIPFIEEENSEGQQRILLTQQQAIELALCQSESGKQWGKSSGESVTVVPRNTTPSSHTTTPLSSPNRQSSTPMSMSPPGSPPFDPSSFPYEEMTARFLIGGPGQPSSTGSPSSATTTVVTKTKLSQLPTLGTLTVLPVETTTPKVDPYLMLQGDPKVVGKETKGANIVGLIKSKTADFEKYAKEQQSSPSSTSITSNLRLRSQGNIQLKQQFLLRQQQQQLPSGGTQGPSPSRSSSGVSVTSSTGERPRPLTRKKPLAASSTSLGPTQGTSTQPTTTSRWKRSEIISSRQSGGRTDDPESTS